MSDNGDIKTLKEKINVLEAEVAETRQLKEALRESEDRYARLQENVKEEFLFFRHDTKGKFTDVSPSYANILGYTPEEYIGLELGDQWSSNPINVEALKKTELSCQGVKQPPYELEIYHKCGALRRFSIIETPIFDEKSRVVAVEGIARDITEKRKIEEQLEKYRMKLEELVETRTQELQASRKQLAEIIDFFPAPLYVVDTNRQIIAWNRAMEAMTSIPKEKILGVDYKEAMAKFYAPSDPDMIQMILDDFFCDKSSPGHTTMDTVDRERLDNNDIKRNGNTLFTERYIQSMNDMSGGHVWITTGPILDVNNQVTGVVEAIRNVTQIKQSERKIRENERRLSTLMSNLPGMAYRLKSNADNWMVEFVSEGSRQIFGNEPSFFINKPITDFKPLIYPDDIKRLTKKALSALHGKHTYECEYQIITGEGETKWVFDKAEVHQNKRDKSLTFEGIISDFTVFKKMEERLRNENMLLRSTIRDRHKFKNIIGSCQAMQEVFTLIVNAATSNDNVFIFGESGTGKELVAHAIHDASDRKDNRFVAVNCAAIPENLIESEFFGATKGAFTGAITDKPGYLEIADGGTLFLDEIGDISPNLQVKLLRAIDGGGFSPVGSRKTIQPDLRIVAASNKDLKALMEEGSIRQDFFFRIHVIPIHLPPLRERGDDIFMLVNHYLKEFSPSDSINSLTQDELETLRNYHWPGNVRELHNVLRRYIALGHLHFLELPGQKIVKKKRKSDIDIDTVEMLKDISLQDALLRYERQIILKRLEQEKWNKTRTARVLGVSRKTLFRKIKALGLD